MSLPTSTGGVARKIPIINIDIKTSLFQREEPFGSFVPLFVFGLAGSACECFDHADCAFGNRADRPLRLMESSAYGDLVAVVVEHLLPAIRLHIVQPELPSFFSGEDCERCRSG